MIGKLLEGVQQGLAEQSKTAAVKFQEAQAAPGEIGTIHAAAAQTVKANSDALAAAQKAHEDSAAALQAAGKAKSGAEADKKKGDQGHAELTATLAKLEACLANDHGPLKEGTVAAGKAKARAQAVAQQAKAIGVEAQVSSSLAAALAKVPDMRGTFDHLIMDTVDKAFASHLASLKADLAKETAAQEERANKVAATSGTHEQAVANEKASKDAVAAAKAELTTAKEALKKAATELGPFAKSIKKAEAGAKAAQERLDGFASGVLTEYTELRDRVTPAASA